MAIFQVTLRNLKEPSVSRSLEVQAPSREQAALQAARDGFLVALVKPLPAKQRSENVGKGFSQKELIKLFRGLASMLKANITTADALLYYAQGLPEPELQACLHNIRERVESGQPVHLAFAKERHFDGTIITIIEAGADSGQLGQAFSSLARRIKTEMTFRGKLRSALLVPGMVILFQIGLFIWSQTSVVSKVEATIKGIHQEPDPISKVIFSFSHVVQWTWPFFVGALVVIGVGVARSPGFRQGALRFMMQRWVLLRRLVMGLRQSSWVGTLQMLYANGINLARASAIAAKVTEGTSLYDGLMRASKSYEGTGIPFAEAIRRNTDLDPQVVHMIGIGEKSASLPQQLELLRDIYDEDTAAYMGDFTEVINFITLAAAVFLIGLVFSGAMLPIFLMGPKMMNSGSM
ncbi:MAG: type II secretion system F family protein [Verrucomicrobiota bacterium]